MKLLVDSHALIWLLMEPDKLSTRAREALHSADATLFMSAATVWELELKQSKGKLRLPEGWVRKVQEHGMIELPIHFAEAAASARLPWHHADPFDRMLIAQAKLHGFTLVSRDSVFAQYKVPLIKA